MMGCSRCFDVMITKKTLSFAQRLKQWQFQCYPSVLPHWHPVLTSYLIFCFRCAVALVLSWWAVGCCQDWTQARGISVWKAPSKSKCHQIKGKGRKKKASWQPQAFSQLHSASATQGKNVTQANTRTHTNVKPFFDLSANHRDVSGSRHCQMQHLCFHPTRLHTKWYTFAIHTVRHGGWKQTALLYRTLASD